MQLTVPIGQHCQLTKYLVTTVKNTKGKVVLPFQSLIEFMYSKRKYFIYTNKKLVVEVKNNLLFLYFFTSQT